MRLLDGLDPVALAAAIRGRDPDVMDRDGLAAHRGDIAALVAWCDAQQVRTTRAQRRLAGEGRAEHPKSALACEGRQSDKDARAADERERVCTAMPGFEDALTAGVVSAGHVDAVAAAMRGLDGPARAEFASHADGLVADAVELGVDAFGRECRDLARLITATSASASDADVLERQRRMSKVSRWTDPQTGMRHTQIVLDPVRDALLWAGIDRARRASCVAPPAPARSRGTNCKSTPSSTAVTGDTTGETTATGGVMVLIDLDTLTHSLHDHSVCELSDGTPLPVSTIRRMACSTEIIPVVLDGSGRALDVGMSQRLATEAQRLALRAMYTTCGYPGCTVAFDACEIHHVIPWENGGPTDLSNLVPLCLIDGHHHLVHEGGWNLTMTPDRTITITRPDGQEWFHGSTIDRAPNGLTPSDLTTVPA